MINTSQLQIGSWVRQIRNKGMGQMMNSEFQIRETNTLSNIINDPDFYEGIPISPDWMKKSGLLEDKEVGPIEILNQTFYWKDGVCLRECCEGTRYRFEFGDMSGVNLDYVHQLQLFMAGLGRPITFETK